MANRERGEETVTLEGVDYTLRPTWEAIEEVEALTGKSAEALMNAANGGRILLRELAAVIGAFLRAYGRAEGTEAALFKDANIASIIQAENGGTMILRTQIGIVLFKAVSGGYDTEGKPKPWTKTMKRKSPPSGADEGSQA